MHPSRHISKTYRVTVRPDISEEQLIALSSGVELDGKMTLPANVVVKTKEPNRVVLLMTSIGPLKLGMLKPGTYRDLTAEELRAIRNAIGGDL